MRLSLVELIPKTGRKHQIRVHLAEQLECPILGDLKYFCNQPMLKHLHLHAHGLVIQNYFGPRGHLSVKAPIPQHWVKTMEEFPLFLRKKPVFPKKKLWNL